MVGSPTCLSPGRPVRWMAVCAALSLIACSRGATSEGDPSTPRERRPQTISLTTADDGQVVAAVVKDRLELRLTQDPKCPGYAWLPIVQPDAAVLDNPITSVEESTPGAPGHDIWTYTAVGQGSVEVSLKYVDPDKKYKPGHKVDTFSVTVNVSSPT